MHDKINNEVEKATRERIAGNEAGKKQSCIKELFPITCGFIRLIIFPGGIAVGKTLIVRLIEMSNEPLRTSRFMNVSKLFNGSAFHFFSPTPPLSLSLSIFFLLSRFHQGNNELQYYLFFVQRPFSPPSLKHGPVSIVHRLSIDG